MRPVMTEDQIEQEALAWLVGAGYLRFLSFETDSQALSSIRRVKVLKLRVVAASRSWRS